MTYKVQSNSHLHIHTQWIRPTWWSLISLWSKAVWHRRWATRSQESWAYDRWGQTVVECWEGDSWTEWPAYSRSEWQTGGERVEYKNMNTSQETTMCEALQCMCRYRTANTYKFVTGQKTINISANYTKQNWQVTGLQVCVVLWGLILLFQASKKQCLCFLYRYLSNSVAFKLSSHIAEKVNCTGHFGHVGLCQLINFTFYQLMKAFISW